MFLSHISGCPIFARSHRAKVGLRAMREPFSLPSHKNAGCPIHAVSSHEWAIARKRDPFSFDAAKDVPRTVAQKKFVISTEATGSLTVRRTVERPLHFAFAVACPPHPHAKTVILSEGAAESKDLRLLLLLSFHTNQSEAH